MAEMSVSRALADLSWYNGYYDDLQKIKEYIKSFGNDNHATFPDFLPDDCDTFLRVFWSILVLMYGEYGTSPRYGWVEDRKNATRFIDRVCKDERRHRIDSAKGE